MRISNALATFGLVSLALGVSPAASFDGTHTPGSAVVAVPTAEFRAVPISLTSRRWRPFPSRRSPGRGRRHSRRCASVPRRCAKASADEAVTSLEYAAEQGVPAAQWKLGRMYADGDGVDKNRLRAFEYFQNLTKAHAYDPPGTPQSRFVANAFVSLGQIYLEGIPETSVKSDPTRARQMFSYAASYFADPDAQYQLARLFLDGTGGVKDARQGVKWLGLAANKGQYQAQAALGSILFEGTDVGAAGGPGTVLADGREGRRELPVSVGFPTPMRAPSPRPATTNGRWPIGIWRTGSRARR